MSKFENVNYFKDRTERQTKRDWMRSITRQPNIKPVAKNLKYWANKDRARYHTEFKKFANDLADGVYKNVEDATILGYLVVANHEFVGDEVFDDFINVLPEVDSTRTMPSEKGRSGTSKKFTQFGINKQGVREPVKVVTFKRRGKSVTAFYGLESKRFVKSGDGLNELKGRRGF